MTLFRRVKEKPEMKQPVSDESYFFVDESGDSTFYDAKGNFIVGAESEGCSLLIILGFVETQGKNILDSGAKPSV
jgi:hypothetical protein